MPYRPAEETLVACVWMPRFEIQVERWRHPEYAGIPVALFSAQSQPSLVCCSGEAEDTGLKPGMPLREAMAVAPHALLQEADPYFYADILAQVVVEMETISPLVEPVPPGSVFLCLEGLIAADSAGHVGLYHTRREFVAALERAIRPEWTARIGIGRGKFVAWAAARMVNDRIIDESMEQWVSKSSVTSHQLSVIHTPTHPHTSTPTHPHTDTSPESSPSSFILSPSGKTGWVLKKGTMDFLKPLPVQLLPVSAEMSRKLSLFGIRTLGQLAALSLSSVMAQFGKEGRRAWMLSQGQDEEPLRPRKMVVEIVETLSFDAPEAALAALLVAVQQLLERALKRPERQGRGVRQVRVDALLESGRSWSLTVTPKQPGTLLDTLFPPIRYRLEREHPTEGVEAVTLVLAAFTTTISGQGTLFIEPQEVRRRRLVEAMYQLRTQMGSVPVSRIVEVEPWSRIPERRHQLISYDP